MLFFMRFSEGAYLRVTEASFLCITGAIEQPIQPLSSEIFFAFVNLPDSEISQCVDQCADQRGVGIGRDPVSQISNVAMHTKLWISGGKVQMRKNYSVVFTNNIFLSIKKINFY